jgi:hypothetical protein
MWKKNSVKLLFLLIVLVVSAPFAAAQHGVDVSIRLFDKQLYYPGNEIEIKIEITNTNAETFRFNLADNRLFNIDFTVRTLSNRVLPQSADLIRDRHSDQHIFFREVSIGPGEQFSFFEDLTNYVTIDEPGKYIVQAHFYPDLLKTGVPSEKIVSNSLNLSVRPDKPALELQTIEDTYQMARLEKQNLPPDEVVSWTITARQKSNWDGFFLYLNLENLLKKNGSRRRQYLSLSQEEQRRMLAEYKNDLQNELVDGDIVVIPEEFEIIKTVYTPEEATVLVKEWFTYPTYREVKEYTYYLRKRDNIWFIYDYDVQNIGTE